MQEPNIQESICRVLGRPLSEVSPEDAALLLRQLDGDPTWLGYVALVLAEHVARTVAKKDSRTYALAVDAVHGLRLLVRTAELGLDVELGPPSSAEGGDEPTG